MKPTIIFRDEIIYVEFFLSGVRKRRSTGLPKTPKNIKYVERVIIPLLLEELEKPNFSFSRYAHEYLESKVNLKSFSEIRHVVNELSVFNDFDIKTINAGVIRRWLQGQDCSPKTLRNKMSVFRGILDLALFDEVISKNPFIHIPTPKGVKPEIFPFSRDEVSLILNACDDLDHKNFLAISFYTGMRSGEVLALSRDDIDLEHRIIHVRSNLTRGKLTTPKTRYSVRDIPIFQNLLSFLQSQLARTKKYLFVNSKGALYYDISSFKNEEWKDLLASLGLPHRRRYNTRHTFATTLLADGVDLLTISRLMGHANTRMVIDVYAKNNLDKEPLKYNLLF